MPPDKSLRFLASLSAVVKRCWKKAAVPPEWSCALSSLKKALETSAANRFSAAAADANRGAPDPKEIQSYLELLCCGPGARLRVQRRKRAGLGLLRRAISTGALSRRTRYCGRIRRPRSGRFAARRVYGLRESEGQKKVAFRLFSRPQQAGNMAPCDSGPKACGRNSPRAPNGAARRRRTREGGGETRAPAKDAAPDPNLEGYLAMLQAILMVW